MRPVPSTPDSDATLARHSIRQGPDGYDAAVLAALAAARGWAWSTEPVAGTPGLGAANRWRALVFAPGDRDPSAGGGLGSRSARATGPTEGAALARALAHMLERAEPTG